MSSKGKHDVSNARTRLDATLQSLVEKKEDSYDSTQESDDDTDLQLPLSVEVVRSTGTPVSSPSKRHAQHRSKKRKRKDDGSGIGTHDAGTSYHHTTYVMKLFDRSVDLAQFDESTPLYPIARAWINSQSQSNAGGSTTDDGKDTVEEEETAYPKVYSLPPPVKLKVEFGELRDPRIPVPLPCTEAPLDIHADPDYGPPPEELLLRHMARWKQIRNQWVVAARVNEMKYNESMNVLKDMFEKNLAEQNYE